LSSIDVNSSFKEGKGNNMLIIRNYNKETKKEYVTVYEKEFKRSKDGKYILASLPLCIPIDKIKRSDNSEYIVLNSEFITRKHLLCSNQKQAVNQEAKLKIKKPAL
jgi:transcriptional regulator of met regulon